MFLIPNHALDDKRIAEGVNLVFSFVQTDMGNRGAEFAGLEKAPDTIEDSAAGIVNEVSTDMQCVIEVYLTVSRSGKPLENHMSDTSVPSMAKICHGSRTYIF